MFREIFSQADHYLQSPSSGEKNSHARFQNVVNYIKKLRLRYDANNFSRNLEKKCRRVLLMSSLFKEKEQEFVLTISFFFLIVLI